MKRWRKLNFSEKGSNNSQGFKGVQFVVTYHPSLNCLSRIIKDDLNVLYMSREVRELFSPGPTVLFRSARRISSYLVRAKLCLLERCAGWRQCKKRRCKVCTNVTETDTFISTVTVCTNVAETDTFISTVTGETFQINH